ncbi:glycerate kinase, partial [Klebsiella pneumoniae]
MGAALIAYTGATLRPGIDLVLELIRRQRTARRGAAGGMGAALIAYTGATLRPGIDLVLEL